MIVAKMPDFNFSREALNYSIVSYRVNYTSTKGSFPIENIGQKFNAKVLEAINNAVVGTTISFSDIVVKRTGVPGTRPLETALVYTIK